MEKRIDTVIIGSGICGLSLAHFLSKQSNDFVVLEASNKIGGIIQTENKSEFICENGPNTVLLNNDAIIELIKDCELWDELNFPSEISNKNRYVLYNNELTLIPTSFKRFISSPLLSITSKLRILFEPFVRKHTENTTVYDFVVKRFGKGFHDQLIEPFITGIYAGDTKMMSAKHSLKILWNLEQTYGSVLRGLFKQKRKAKQMGSFNLPMGLSQLIHKIAEPIKDRISLNTEIKTVVKNEFGYEVYSESGSILCKKLICAVPAYSLSKMFTDEKLKSALEGVKYTPVDVFHFGFKKENIKNQAKGFGVLTKPSDNKSYLGILFSSRTFENVAPKDSELFTVLVGGERQKELCELPIEQLEKRVLNELEQLIGHQGALDFKKHYRWKRGIPQYDMHQEKLNSVIAAFEAQNSELFILGNFYAGISVSDCILKAKNIVNKLA
jgi:oxygen-dependent protoporphyrinogen oxidase